MQKFSVLALSATLAAGGALFAVPADAAPARLVPSLASMSGTAHVQEV